jgi:hypothetical protein
MIPARDYARYLQRKLLPGFEITIDREFIADLEIGNPGFTPEEWLMEYFLGGAFEFQLRHDEFGNAIIRRLREPLKDGLRSYVSPDRRHLFRQLANGLWLPIEEQAQ